MTETNKPAQERDTSSLRKWLAPAACVMALSCVEPPGNGLSGQADSIVPPLPASIEAAPQCVDIASLETPLKVGQLLIVLEETNNLDRLAAEGAAAHIGGFGISELEVEMKDEVDYNGTSAPVGAVFKDIKSRISSANHGVSTLFGLDEEGGNVQRAAGLSGFPELPSPREQAEVPPAEAATRYTTHLQLIRDQLGVNTVFGPVLDDGDGSQIGNRSFSGNRSKEGVATVSEYGAAITNAIWKQNMEPVGKHFPGLGAVYLDSHFELVTTPHIDELLAVDIEVYRNLAATTPLRAIMMSHGIIPGATDGLPATIHPAMYTLARDIFGSDTVIITDSLGMEGVMDAVSQLPEYAHYEGDGRQAPAAALSFAAGADVLIIHGAERIAPTVELLSRMVTNDPATASRLNESVKRILAMKGHTTC